MCSFYFISLALDSDLGSGSAGPQNLLNPDPQNLLNPDPQPWFRIYNTACMSC
jgi:hypothetical protein